jgi:hypothetical protein
MPRMFCTKDQIVGCDAISLGIFLRFGGTIDPPKRRVLLV